jgi:hypothetical protein
MARRWADALAERLTRGDSDAANRLIDSLDPSLALAAIAKLLWRERTHPTSQTHLSLWIAIAVCAGLLPFLPLFVVVAMPFLLVTIGLRGQRKDRPSVSSGLLATIGRLAAGLDRASAVPPLIEAAAAAGHRLGGENERKVAAALTRLLPRLTVDESLTLTAGQRQFLRARVRESFALGSAWDEAFSVAALCVLAAYPDDAAYRLAEGVERHHRSERMKAAAEEILRLQTGRETP